MKRNHLAGLDNLLLAVSMGAAFIVGRLSVTATRVPQKNREE